MTDHGKGAAATEIPVRSSGTPTVAKSPFAWFDGASAEALARLWRLFGGAASGAGPARMPPQRANGAPDRFNDMEPPASIDRLLHASIGRFTAGLSPASLALAYADWAMHLAGAPGKQQQLCEKAVRKAVRLFTYLARHGS